MSTQTAPSTNGKRDAQEQESAKVRAELAAAMAKQPAPEAPKAELIVEQPATPDAWQELDAACIAAKSPVKLKLKGKDTKGRSRELSSSPKTQPDLNDLDACAAALGESPKIKTKREVAGESTLELSGQAPADHAVKAARKILGLPEKAPKPAPAPAPAPAPTGK